MFNYYCSVFGAGCYCQRRRWEQLKHIFSIPRFPRFCTFVILYIFRAEEHCKKFFRQIGLNYCHLTDLIIECSHAGAIEKIGYFPLFVERRQIIEKNVYNIRLKWRRKNRNDKNYNRSTSLI